MRVRKGDTLVEVMFAVGIFGMIAVGAISLMNRGLYVAQNSLETTMARQEIDAQIESLRYIHSAYVQEAKRDESVYRPIWLSITSNAYTADHTNSGILLEDNDFYTRTIENGQTCDEIYHAGYPSKSFVINPRRLDSTTADIDTVVYYDNSSTAGVIIRPAELYPRLLYGTTEGGSALSDVTVNDDHLTIADSSRLTAAEGIWVTTVVSDAGINTDNGFQPDFFDFYVHTCWNKAGGGGSTTINSILRLYNSDQIVYDARTRYQGWELFFETGGGEPRIEPLTYDDITYPTHTFDLYDHENDRPLAVPAKQDRGEDVPFLGWAYTDDKGQVRMYCEPPNSNCAGETFTAKEHFKNVLTAVWGQPVKYELEYVLGGGKLTGSMVGKESSDLTYQDTHTFSVQGGVPTKGNEGEYIFLGWYDTASGSADDESYAAGREITLDKDHPTKKLYARWKRQYLHTIKYDANGGANAPAGASVWDENATRSFTIAGAGTMSYADHDFLGWSESSSATAADSNLAPGGSVEVGTEKTLYAVWKQHVYTFTLKYDKNTTDSVSGMPSNPAPQTGTGTSKSFTLASGPARTGYVFVGWGETAGSTAPVANPYSVSRDVGGGTTLYAIWRRITLQEWNSCDSLTQDGASISLMDARDNEIYPVAKLRDGKCWMTKNLRFNFTSYGWNLNESNTNVSFTDANDRAAFVRKANSNPGPQPTGELSRDQAYNYYNNIMRKAEIGYNNQNLGGTDCPSGNCDEYGVYYNFYAAPNVCPKGWGLPYTYWAPDGLLYVSGGSSGGYQGAAMYLTSSPANYTFSGGVSWPRQYYDSGYTALYYTNGLEGRGEFGLFRDCHSNAILAGCTKYSYDYGSYGGHAGMAVYKLSSATNGVSSSPFLDPYSHSSYPIYYMASVRCVKK